MKMTEKNQIVILPVLLLSSLILTLSSLVAFASHHPLLSPNELSRRNGSSIVFLPLIIKPEPVISRISISSDGIQANGHSGPMSISASGRFITFVSSASNLVHNDTNSDYDIFLYDQYSKTIERVSLSNNGLEGNGSSGSISSPSTAISADGRFVAFVSDASNLVTYDTNSRSDIFVRDRQTGETERVSVASDGSEGNDHSYFPSISTDGRFVAFESYANNLVPNDTNECQYHSDGHCPDVFVHDQATGNTIRVSVNSNGFQGNAASGRPDISADGRYVMYQSYADNLAPGDFNNAPDMFVNDLSTGQTFVVSVASNSNTPAGGAFSPSISADGRFVAFMSSASNLVPHDTNMCEDVFVYDRQADQTSRVSMSSEGVQGDNVSGSPEISADGRFVVFMSWAGNLVSDDTNHFRDIFIHDRQTGETKRVSVSTNFSQANSVSVHPAISADGRFIGFRSGATNLIPNDTNGFWDVFIYDQSRD